MSKRSRLTKKFEKRSKQTLILSLLGIALLLFIILRYGIPLISDISFNLGQVTSSLLGKDDKDSKKNVEEEFLAIPTLDSLPEATNKDNLIIEGSSPEGTEVELFVNGDKADSTKADSDGSFRFSVDLTEGTNIIKARAVRDDKESDFSDSQEVLFKKTPPDLSIDSPHDGDSVNQSPINISGKTDKDVEVTVNGFVAILQGEGNYSYSLALSNGDNEVKVVAIDLAGNKTEKSIKIQYSP